MTAVELIKAQHEIQKTKSETLKYWATLVEDTPLVEKKSQIWDALKNSAEYEEQVSIEKQLNSINFMTLQQVTDLCARSKFIFIDSVSRAIAEIRGNSSHSNS